MLIGDIYQFPATADYNDGGGQMLLCDGRAINPAVYPVLAALCGANIPNFGNDGMVTGRTPIGADPAGGGYALGAIGGLQTHGHNCVGVLLTHKYVGGAVDTSQAGNWVFVEPGPFFSPAVTHTHPLPSLAAITHTGFPPVDNLANVAPYIAMGIFIKAT